MRNLKIKQHYHLRNEIGNYILNTMHLAPHTSEDLLASPLSKFITFAANDCGYIHSFIATFITVVHPFFLKTKSEASKEHNPN